MFSWLFFAFLLVSPADDTVTQPQTQLDPSQATVQDTSNTGGSEPLCCGIDPPPPPVGGGS